MSGTPSEFINKSTEIVRAGAGAGKTRALSLKVISICEQFLKENKSLPKLIVTTFTRKATEELRERITTYALESKTPGIKDLVRSRQYLHVSTIHGVLSLFLRNYGTLAGLDSDFQVLDTQASRNLAKRTLKDVLKKHSGEVGLFESFSFEQCLDAFLDYRRSQMTYPSSKPFSAKDFNIAKEKLLNPRLGHLIELTESAISQCSHQKWNDYLKKYRSELDNPLNISVRIKNLDPKPQFRGEPFDPEVHKEWKDTFEEIVSLESKPGFSSELWPRYEALANELISIGPQFIHELNKTKIEMGLFDSEDLELFSLDVIRKEPQLGKAFAADWDHWLVDEYQDTSPTQVEIINQLMGSRPVFFVGDPQQSIYLFRGARKEVFEQRQTLVENSGGIFSQLNINYRSRPELLLAINDQLRAMGPDFLPMKTKSDEIDKKHIAIQTFISGNEENPYSEIARNILESIKGGARADDFCVLARTNQVLMNMAVYFESLNIPCCVHSASGYFSRREVLDLMSLLKFLWNPFDHMNLIRLLRSPWFRVDDQKLVDWQSAKANSLWHHILNKHKEEASISQLIELQSQVRKSGLSSAFIKGLASSKMIELSHYHDPTGRRESNIWKLINWISTQERKPGYSPVKLFRQFDLALMGFDEESDAAASKEPNRVNLMTVHKSKGLNFKHVIIPHMEKRPKYSTARAHENVFVFSESEKKWCLGIEHDSKLAHAPSALLSLQQLEDRERDENQRLLYVAMTRAEESLWLHVLDKDRKSKKPMPKDAWAASLKFLNEGKDLIEKVGYRIKIHRDNSGPIEIVDNQAAKKIKIPDRFLLKLTESAQNRFSVSSLIEEQSPLAEITPESEVKPASVDAIQTSLMAPSLGTILHSAFEGLKYGSRETSLEKLSGFIDKNELDQYSKSFDYVLNLKSPPMQMLIKNGEVEWGFQLKTHRGILEGQIDLWGKLDEEVFVVDYKSGNPRYSEKALQQLRLYAYALHQAYGFKNFQLAVVYPLAEKTKIESFSDFATIQKTYFL